MTKSLVFFGNERLATGVTTEVLTLKTLIQKGYDIKAVVSNYEKAVSRNNRSLEIEFVAAKAGITFLVPNKLKEILDQLINLKADAGILVAYGKIVPQSIIDIFPKGILNIHPSALPEHRGPTPIENVILEGSKSTAVSIMSLTKEMDAGPLYAHEQVPLIGNETKQQLSDLMLKTGASLLLKNLPAIFKDRLRAYKQDDLKATYDTLLTKSMGIIDWSKSATNLEREIRAYAVWPGSRTVIADTDVILIKARVKANPVLSLKPGTILLSQSKEKIEAVCATDILEIEQLKPAGRNIMTAKEFIAGHHKYFTD